MLAVISRRLIGSYRLLLFVDVHKKREPTDIGSSGLPHPQFPNMQKAHAST